MANQQQVYVGFVDGEVLESAKKLVDYLKDDERGDFQSCPSATKDNHIYLDIERLNVWIKDVSVPTRYCGRLAIAFYVGLVLSIVCHWAWHLRLLEGFSF